MSICLRGFRIDELETVKGWDGFVSPDGIFYKVAERGALSADHDEFVEYYCDMIVHINLKDLQKRYQKLYAAHLAAGKRLGFSNKDLFIHLLGFTNVEYQNGHLEIEPPNPIIAGQDITDKQLVTISRLIYVNNDSIDDLNQAFKFDKHVGTDFSYCKRW